MAYQFWGEGTPFLPERNAPWSNRADLRIGAKRSRPPFDARLPLAPEAPADLPDPEITAALSRWSAERRARLEPELRLDTWSAIRDRLHR